MDRFMFTRFGEFVIQFGLVDHPLAVPCGQQPEQIAQAAYRLAHRADFAHAQNQARAVWRRHCRLGSIRLLELANRSLPPP
jgi:hypothetical protein